MIKLVLLASMFLYALPNAFPQGTFVNLNFEHPVLPLMPVNSLVPVADALPGWTAYSGTLGNGNQVFYNDVSTGAAAIALQGPGSLVEPILEGSYSVVLGGSSLGAPATAAIGQTGQIPLNSESLRFFGRDVGDFQVTFNGQILPYGTIGTGPNYSIYGANISAFAGQTGLLLFTALPNGGAELDNIQFSASAVPEPRVLDLLGFGLLLFGFRRCLKAGLRK